MNIQGHEVRHDDPDRQRAWDLLASVESDPQVAAWLKEAEARPRRFAGVWAAAASVVAAIGLGVGAWVLHAGDMHYQTQVGEQRDVNLPDGSKMTLNTDTALTVRYSEQRRFIELERGEALFTVKHDAVRPFEVEAGDVLTQALGTEFNVDLRSSKVTVSVLEGAVRVAAPKATNGTEKAGEAAVTGLATVAALAKGQAVEVHRQDGRVREEKADLRRIDAWRTRRLEFSDTPLVEAVEEFNRYSANRIVIGTPGLGAVRVSGVFRIGDADGFLFSLQEVLHLQSHESGNEIVLLRAAPAGR